MPGIIPRFRDADSLCGWLSGQRNDLESTARRIAPAITDTLRALSGLNGCGLSRMSGSGATCFGLFADEAAARAAARLVALANPSWWVVSAALATPS